VELLYFAWVREAIGIGNERVAPPADVATVADLIEWLRLRGGGYEVAFRDPSRLRAAIDHQFVPSDTALSGAREIAIFPPVTGG
jgi:molybdopterin synthase sulfur carrier subunit